MQRPTPKELRSGQGNKHGKGTRPNGMEGNKDSSVSDLLCCVMMSLGRGGRVLGLVLWSLWGTHVQALGSSSVV